MIWLKTMAFGIAGGFVAFALNWPSAWLLGSLACVAMVAMLGQQVDMPKQLTSNIQILIGLSMGANVDANLAQLATQWVPSLVLMAVEMLALLIAIPWLYRRYFAFPKAEAMFSSVPGTLAMTLALASDSGADVKRVALAHTVRLVFLVSSVPLLMPLLGLVPHGIDPSQSGSLVACALALVAATGGAWLARRTPIPAPNLLGAMATTLIIQFVFDVNLRLPSEAVASVLVVLGTVVGAKLNNLNMKQTLGDIKAGAAGLGLGLLISLVFAFLATELLGVPFLAAMLAYSPGGIEVMIMLATVFDIDPAYVGAHHLARVLMMGVALPIWAAKLQNHS